MNNFLKGLLALLLSVLIFLTSPIWVMQLYALVMLIGWLKTLGAVTCVWLFMVLTKAEA